MNLAAMESNPLSTSLDTNWRWHMRRNRDIGMKTILGLMLALMASTSFASDVYLNGKKITGYSDVDFGKVEVKLDKAGNVRITAPDFKVQEMVPQDAANNTASKPAVANPAGLKKQYFIVTEETRPAVTGFDVKLIINNKYIKTIPDTIAQNVVELNEFLKAGSNTISFFAKRDGRTAKSTSPDDKFTLMIGVGTTEGGKLSIEEVLHEFTIKATDTGEPAKSFTLVAN